MSGHSKWATIKHKKGAADKARGKLVRQARPASSRSRPARVAATSRPTPRCARSYAEGQGRVRCPTTPSTGAIKRGTGELDGRTYEAITYEGYAPGGVALLIDVLTDNRNRTGAEVRNIFSKHRWLDGRARRGRLAVHAGEGVIVVRRSATRTA